jgi:hypothetical protein
VGRQVPAENYIRPDYLIGDGYAYSELIELVTHRCFIIADKPHLWPDLRVDPYQYR